MRFYHYILIFILIAVIARGYYLFFRKSPLTIEEGFESLESCLTQGYPTQFCKRVPIQSYITGA
jgi:hypothetical protein